MPTPTLDDVYARADRMIGRRIGDGFVLVPVASRGADLDGIFNLNRTAAFIWEHLDGQRNGHVLVSALTQRFEVETEQAAHDYLELAAQLLSVDAIRHVLPASTGAKR